MKRIIVFIIPFFLCTQSYSQSIDFRKLELEINQVKKDWNIPGLAIAIIRKDSIVYSNAFGYRDLKRSKLVTKNTVFGIGSNTKAFTAALLGLLEKQGKIDFNLSPSKYIPNFKFFNDELTNNVRIKDLLTHSSGLAQHDMSFYLFPTNSIDSLVNRIQYLKPNAKPKEKYTYNNISYTLNGVIAEYITGKSWKENIETNFFQPLKMNDTYISAQDLNVNKDISFGYKEEDGNLEKLDFYKFTGRDPAGSIYSSLSDMVKWTKLWLNDGKIDSLEVIPSSHISNALRPQFLITSRVPKTNKQSFFDSYSYGWKVSTYNGHYIVNHHGGEYGFSSMIALYPADHYAIIILTNKYDVFPPYILRDIIADRIFNLEKTDWNKVYLDFVNNQPKAKNIPVEYKNSIHGKERYLGQYTNKGYGTIDVIDKDGNLIAVFPEYQFKLKQLKDGSFDAYPCSQKGDYIMNIFKSKNKPFLFKFNFNKAEVVINLELDLEPSINEHIIFLKQ